MAISFSRPDPSSPAAVADANFPTSRRGFDQQEVRDFLRMVAAELARSQERERYLEQELRTRRQQPMPPALPADLDDETIARLLGEETTRIVQAARESASAIRSKAEESSERLLRDAREESQRVREDAELEATRRRKDAEVDAEAELEMAKQQGREMVDEARAYRERALSELARRRDLARQQIDQLVHGRDRLVQAFERARLAASDVVAELVPLGELDEYVNLSPTTGPVPVMVPASKLADRSAISDDALALHVPPEDPADPPLAAATATDAPIATGETVGVVATDIDNGHVDDGTDDDPTPEESTVLADEAPADEAPADEAPAASSSSADEAPADELEAEIEPEPTVEAGPVGRDATVLQFPVQVFPVTDGDDTVEINIDDEIGDDPTVEIAVAPGLDHDPDEANVDDAGLDRGVGDEIDDDDVTASDVDDLFARLRAQRTGDPPAESPAATGPVAPLPTPTTPGAPFEHRDEVITPLIVAAARKLKRVLADEQNDALDTLRRKEPVTALDQLLPALDDHARRYADAVSGDLVAAAQAGADTVRDLGHLAHSVVAADLAAVDAAIRDDLIVPLRDRLADRIRVGEADNEIVTKSARAIYREWKTKHIDDHLDDLLRLAFNRGVLVALPAGTLCRWTADPSVGACADCDDNTLQAPVPAGQGFPTGHVTAPAHPGCRCLLAPDPPH